MIKLDVMAGLGNQLFEYAYARALSLEYGEPIIMNTKNAITLLICIRSLSNPKNAIFDFQLRYFNIAPYKMQNPIFGFIESIPPAVHACLHRHKQHDNKKMSDLFYRMSAKGKHYFADTALNGYFPHAPTKASVKHVHGIWISEKYFSKYKEVIMDELRVITPLSNQNRLMIEDMNNCNSIAVHIRKGDRLKVKKLGMNIDICSEGYYHKSMQYIADNVKNPVFYIFSDSIDWVRSNMNFEFDVKFVCNNNPGYEDLRLMYNCKHFIMANSTFSWWGSYLSTNLAKIVVVPNIYIGSYPESRDFFRDDMVLLSVDG